MILADLDSAIKNVEDTAFNLPGLQDPGEPGVDVGAELGQDLQLAIEMFNGAYRRLEALFQEED